MTAIEKIKKQQKHWADAHSIKYDEALRVLELDDNFYQPFGGHTKREILKGAGAEVGQAGRRGKIFSLYSSAALVVNVFDHWRSKKDTATIARLCGAESEMTEVEFEKQHRTPLGGTPPHLDLEFQGRDVASFAVESKFTEPYSGKRRHRIEGPYVDAPDLWKRLPACGELAKMNHTGAEEFFCLDAPQLLKHILGLTNAYGKEGFALLYLWYYLPGDEAQEHRKEMDRFLKLLSGEVSFAYSAHVDHLFRLMPTTCSA